ncbi:MAG: alpha/beta hydrolase [Acidobacteriia bacterium]|nr:alpha/beta hydrolase [Terriglobia bacterium]
MARRFIASTFLFLLAAEATCFAGKPKPVQHTWIIRGQKQDVYIIAGSPSTTTPHLKILFVPGDGGWRGFAITIAETMASWGYDVYALDTKRYLEGFSGKTGLTVTDVMSDFRLIAELIVKDKKDRLTLVGWSEGAGLCLLGAAGPENRKTFDGLVTIGLGPVNILGWRLADYLTYVTKEIPQEPRFRSAEYLPQVTPLPLWMIQSSHDEYVPVSTARDLFSAAKEPKRFELIEANDHRFDGNTTAFLGALRRGIEWILSATQ